MPDQKRTRDNLYRRGDVWYVRLQVDGREIRRAAGRDKQVAQVLLARLRADAERRRVGLPKRTIATLRDWMPRYLDWAKQRKRSWTRDALSLRSLVSELGDLRLCDITTARVEAYMRDRLATPTVRGGRRAPASVNREVACLRKVLSHAVEHGEIEVNPLRGIKMLREAPARVPTLDLAEERALLGASPEWMRPIIRLAVSTGCRLGEVLALRWRHVDFDAGTVQIEDSKSGESRIVPLHPAILDELTARRGTPDGWLCVSPETGRPPHATAVSHAFKRAARKIGRPDLRLHDLRHVAGTRLLAAGASLPEVASVLGHKTLAMSRRYAHTTWTRLRDLVSRMPAPAPDEAVTVAGGPPERSAT